MRKSFIIIGALAIAVTGWTQLGAQQQEMLSRPGPGSGITRSAQHGDWEVAISNTPTVRVANTLPVHLRGPVFLKNRTYKVVWPNGDEERLTMISVPDQRVADRSPERPDRSPERLPERSAEAMADTWAEVQTASGNRRWINLLAARSIEETR